MQTKDMDVEQDTPGSNKLFEKKERKKNMVSMMVIIMTRRFDEGCGCEPCCRSRTWSCWWVVHKLHVQSVRLNWIVMIRVPNDAVAATRWSSTSTSSAGTGSSCRDATRPTTVPVNVRSSTCRRMVPARTSASNSSGRRPYDQLLALVEVRAVRRGVCRPSQCCTTTSTITSSTADYRKWSSNNVAARRPLPTWQHAVYKPTLVGRRFVYLWATLRRQILGRRWLFTERVTIQLYWKSDWASPFKVTLSKILSVKRPSNSQLKLTVALCDLARHHTPTSSFIAGLQFKNLGMKNSAF